MSVVIHLLIPHEKGRIGSFGLPAKGKKPDLTHFTQYGVACDPEGITSPKGVNDGYALTGEALHVNCEKCKATSEYQEVLLSQNPELKPPVPEEKHDD